MEIKIEIRHKGIKYENRRLIEDEILYGLVYPIGVVLMYLKSMCREFELKMKDKI